jgi:hypothetical protein
MFEVAVSVQIVSLFACMSDIYIENANSIKYVDLYIFEVIVGECDLL